jgi:hypothetical protein
MYVEFTNPLFGVFKETYDMMEPIWGMTSEPMTRYSNTEDVR